MMRRVARVRDMARCATGAGAMDQGKLVPNPRKREKGALTGPPEAARTARARADARNHLAPLAALVVGTHGRRARTKVGGARLEGRTCYERRRPGGHPQRRTGSGARRKAHTRNSGGARARAPHRR
jgi:hypothetical protein